ncbi:Chemotaxis protein methyltransferase CheR [Actinokineospora spheciospongiae]|uniref:protein-glutamate O-methyltransferase n=1 Tax=Actinokineospora spheciospongiae TaxID=909613 RepID=W7JB18_9PSEU|nr:CheR family methyltransferase [Actinokineospora spheciospongiae]EWC63254.1 Chemotaxis protein methyltransferase CheR [Actinokineospora spheciospongiae]PWW66916.1 two-component system CheB/CheR fusion protein [Actinokineospora spheciospongiae]
MDADPAFEALLEHLKRARGFDFTGYKRTSLGRRVRQRMTQVGIADFADYTDHLQANADEFSALFNTILINVTGFFRDQEAWDHLRAELLGPLVAARSPADPIRAWSAGCASGQEAYTLAMVLAEELGVDQFRRRVKIYATDVDEHALAQARQAVYSAAEVAQVPPPLLEKYFEQVNGEFAFRKDLRRSVIFGRNDLVQDAPISRIDLLTCRNTLMYFNAETQSKILRRLHFALAPQGLLFLGKAEMLLTHGRIFEPVELKRRIFRRAPSSRVELGPVGVEAPPDIGNDRFGEMEQLRQLAFNAAPVAQLVVSADDVLALLNTRAEAVFGLSQADIGKPLRDLEVSYRPVELRGHVDVARVQRRAVRVEDVQWQRGGMAAVWFRVVVEPLTGGDNGLVGVVVTFHDITATRVLLDELAHANRQLEVAYEELQSTNEELETTNEELQSTVEELETTNEELQSTNEELETINEELQSTNDELQAINEMLRERSIELDHVSEFLDDVLRSLRSGIVVVDLELRVRAWNRGAEELWGLRNDETTGRHLLDLDVGLPVADLRQALGVALIDPAFTEVLVMDAVNRRGQSIRLRLTCGSLRNEHEQTRGAILVMDPVHD